MRSTPRILMASLGVGSIAIALSIMTLGAGQVAALGEGAYNALSGTSVTSPAWPPIFLSLMLVELVQPPATIALSGMDRR